MALMLSVYPQNPQGRHITRTVEADTPLTDADLA